MKVAVIGSTGSVGVQALGVIRKLGRFSVSALIAYSNESLLAFQAKEFRPEVTGLISRDADCVKRAVDCSDIVLFSASGITSLPWIIYAIECGKKIAVANKESLVCGGKLINKVLGKYGGFLRPVDSEHSAVWQCIGNERESVRRIILTASGGAFRDFPKKEIALKKAEDALRHPTWKMGRKITIDSATLMNKAFEVIEAYYLFGKKPSVTLHRQSVVHSMAEFTDGSVKAQLAVPDMALPISYALTYPERLCGAVPFLDFSGLMTLTFEAVDEERFPCIGLADRVLGRENLSAVMNGADDECVKAYIDGRIGFYDIFDIISETLSEAERRADESRLDDESAEGVFARDDFGRRISSEIIKRFAD